MRVNRRPAAATAARHGPRLFRVERQPDAARAAAFEVLRAVTADGAHANTTMPAVIRRAGLTGGDAALAAALGHGTLRAAGTLDEIIGCCSGRRPASLGPDMLNLLRLGTYQLLRTDVPPHLAVSTSLDLTRRAIPERGAVDFAGAVLHQVATAGWDSWAARMSPSGPGPARLALRCAHPEWVVRAYARALGPDADRAELATALRTNDEWPRCDLVAWPGRIGRDELAAGCGGRPGRYSPYAVRPAAGDPFHLDAVRQRRAGLQGEAGQLCTIAVASAPLHGPDAHWLDLCAGPGGTTALLAALGAARGAHVTAVELRPDRAAAVRQATAGMGVDVLAVDGREAPPRPGGYDRVLLDAPCSALGSLRRRPEARWACRPDDVAAAARLQAALLASALRLVRPGGIVGYVVSSPHPWETTDVVAGLDLLDARPAFPGVGHLGPGPAVRLWPHRHDVEATFCALARG